MLIRKLNPKYHLSRYKLNSFEQQRFVSASAICKDDEHLHSGLKSGGFANKNEAIEKSTSILPSQSQIVIAGAGAVANSVAYHLVLKGLKDVVVVEQNKIGMGSSHFGSGTLGLFKPIAHRNLIAYSMKLYKQLQDMGYQIGLKQCGSISLAQTKDRMIALRRRMAYNEPTGLHCEVILII